MMRARGFTLVELLVVLAIAGALLAVAPVALQRYRESTDYRDALRTIAAGLTEARNTAITGGGVNCRRASPSAPRWPTPNSPTTSPASASFPAATPPAAASR
jgi:general secretion pathway protein H